MTYSELQLDISEADNNNYNQGKTWNYKKYPKQSECISNPKAPGCTTRLMHIQSLHLEKTMYSFAL